MKQNYDALVIPTGETSFRDRSVPFNETEMKELLQDKNFPVSSKAAELFKKGNIGYIFITGGHWGFSNGVPFITQSEAKETREYLTKIKGIPTEKIFDDNRSRETLGNFVFPLAYPQDNNPNLSEFDKMLIIGKEGHLWRIVDYVNLVVPSKGVQYHSVPGKHNDGLVAKMYHKGLMRVLNNKFGDKLDPKKGVEFLREEHPFYSPGWYHKPVLKREIEMSKKILEWRYGKLE